MSNDFTNFYHQFGKFLLEKGPIPNTLSIEKGQEAYEKRAKREAAAGRKSGKNVLYRYVSLARLYQYLSTREMDTSIIEPDFHPGPNQNDFSKRNPGFTEKYPYYISFATIPDTGFMTIGTASQNELNVRIEFNSDAFREHYRLLPYDYDPRTNEVKRIAARVFYQYKPIFDRAAIMRDRFQSQRPDEKMPANFTDFHIKKTLLQISRYSRISLEVIPQLLPITPEYIDIAKNDPLLKRLDNMNINNVLAVINFQDGELVPRMLNPIDENEIRLITNQRNISIDPIQKFIRSISINIINQDYDLLRRILDDVPGYGMIDFYFCNMAPTDFYNGALMRKLYDVPLSNIDKISKGYIQIPGEHEGYENPTNKVAVQPINFNKDYSRRAFEPEYLSNGDDTFQLYRWNKNYKIVPHDPDYHSTINGKIYQGPYDILDYRDEEPFLIQLEDGLWYQLEDGLPDEDVEGVES